GWPTTASPSPAATRGASGPSRRKTPTSPSSYRRSSTPTTASSCWKTCGWPSWPRPVPPSSCSSSPTPSCGVPPGPGSPRWPSCRGAAMPEHYDVIVIGSGAGGGTLAWALAPTGKRILLLERGGWLPREKENWSSVAVWGDKRYRNSGPWSDGDGKEFLPKQHYYVGGNTKFYGAIL